MSSSPALQRIVVMFESFAPADVARLEDFYTPDAKFKDPFNEVQGLPPIQRVFQHMFDKLHEPRFHVTSRMAEGDACWIAWDFTFRFKSFKPGEPQLVRGASHLLLAPDGRIRVHRDYWDAAEELYEKIPMLGGFMRWLKQRGASS